MKKIEIGLFFVIMVAILGALIITAVNENSYNIAQVLLTFALVLITFIYAWHTRKMAEEMKEQRYDAIRPLIDIVWFDDGGEIQASNEELESTGIICYLRNIGVGPAVDVYSYLQGNEDKYEFGYLGIGDATGNKRFGLKKVEDRLKVEVYYRDLHGRDYISSREFSHRVNPVGLNISILSSEFIKEQK
jgi:hypothetical protein